MLAPVLIAAALYAFVNAGRYLTAEDPLQKADAIFVLAGTRMDRPLEAADLYRAGWAPLLVLSYGIQEDALDVLEQRGIGTPPLENVARDLLVRDGIPADVFILPARVHDNTAQEAQTLRELAAQHRWQRIIVVSSRYHLRRAGFAFRRELAGTGIELVLHGSRYDRVDPDRWWRSRPDLRWMLSEVPKLLAYVLGLGA